MRKSCIERLNENVFMKFLSDPINDKSYFMFTSFAIFNKKTISKTAKTQHIRRIKFVEEKK